MGFRKDFLGGHKVYHSTEKVISAKMIDDYFVIKTSQHNCVRFKSKKLTKLPLPGSMLTIYYICSSTLVGVDVNGDNVYFLDESDLK